MGMTPLGEKWLRRIAAITGTTVVHGSGSGGYWLDFTTAQHRHGIIHTRTHEVLWFDECPRYTSCRQLFGSQGGGDAATTASRGIRRQISGRH